jgi:hypothetical protein
MGSGQLISGEIDRELYENLDSVIMGDNEHLSTYLKRFNNAIKAYDGTEVAPPSVPLQVRFATFKTSVKSDFRQAGIAYSKTIDEAFLRTSNWELDHPSAVAPPLAQSST